MFIFKSTASSLGLVMHSDRCVLLIAVNWPLSYDHSQGDEDLHDIKNLLEKTKISGTPCIICCTAYLMCVPNQSHCLISRSCQLQRKNCNSSLIYNLILRNLFLTNMLSRAVKLTYTRISVWKLYAKIGVRVHLGWCADSSEFQLCVK